MRQSRRQVKMYLRQIYALTIEIEQRQKEIERLYNPVKGVSYGNVPGNGDADATLHLIEKIDRLKAENEKRIEHLLEVRKEIYQTVCTISNAQSRQAIYLRYFEMMSIKKIASKMSYSEVHIRELIAMGIDELHHKSSFLNDNMIV